ncbi:MAG: FIST C-terminal domain-containing protein [Deltaproteobacteria bacterium]|jgi:hypothetical protein|nr:FIST C-terminal domain-containing protein [Deltaproteobacteria bacterium]
MLKAIAASSTDKNALDAGRQTGQQITTQLALPKISLIYASCDYNLEDVFKGFKSSAPNVPFIGNTSFTGVITPSGIVEGADGFIGALAIEDDALIVGVAGLEKKGSALETGREVAKKAMAKAAKLTPPAFFYMVASPGEEEFYLKGITEVIGRVPCFGGSAADNSINGDWKLYADDLITADGVAVAFFYTSKPFANYYTGAYRETSDVGIITKVADNRILAEIDGEPALNNYASWRKIPTDKLKGMDLLVASVTSPLGVKDRLGDLVAIRHPMAGNDDLTMAVGNNLSEGTAVIRMECTQDELVASASEALTTLIKKAPFDPGAFLLVHCGGRRAGIDDRLGEVAQNLKKVAGDVPFICQFTFGEYGFEQDDRNTCGGLMLSYTALAK